MYNKNTNGEFRELWGDILYISADDYRLTHQNIKAEYLSTIVINLDLSDEEVRIFGKPEEYIFKDESDNLIMGFDLV
jgi:hypothetical protein